MLSKEDIYLLMQLMDGLNESLIKLESLEKSHKDVNKIKNTILDLQGKISGILKND